MDGFATVERVATRALTDRELQILEVFDLRARDADRPSMVAAHQRDSGGPDAGDLGAHGAQTRLWRVGGLAGKRNRKEPEAICVHCALDSCLDAVRSWTCILLSEGANGKVWTDVVNDN